MEGHQLNGGITSPQHSFRRRLQVAGLAVGIIVSIFASGWHVPARAETANYAIAPRWQGYAQTLMPFSDFFGGNHTLAAWFMPEYVRAYRAPIIGQWCPPYSCDPKQKPSFELGMGDWATDPTGQKTKLVLEINGVLRTYLAEISPGTWHHVAVTRTLDGYLGLATTFRLYLDGVKLCADPATYTTCDYAILGFPSPPPGGLAFGRTDLAFTGSEKATNHQFYGLIDDVAVFKSSLTASEVKALFTAKRLTGSESGLYAGYTFDEAVPASGPLSKPWSTPGPTKILKVSTTRSNSDKAKIPLPYQKTKLHLPLAPGWPFRVVQGQSATGSHYGKSAFAFDLVSATVVPTEGQGAYSPADKTTTISEIFDHYEDIDTCANDKVSNCNYLTLKLTSGEFFTLRHLQQYSVTNAFGGFYPPPGTNVVARKRVALIGDHPNGSHLHFGLTNVTVSDKANSVSIPVAYSDYEQFIGYIGDEEFWVPIPIGIPTQGAIIRVPVP